MALPVRPRRHQNTMPGPLVTPEIAFHIHIPKTEEEWALEERKKKLDANDLAHELGPAGFARWLDEGTTYVLKWPDQGDEIVSTGTLLSSYKTMRRPIIHGLLRETETMNIVAAPKMNKSFLVGNLAMNIIGGGQLFGRFQCERGRILVCDNELHEETIAERIRVLAPALNVPIDRAARLIDYMPLRGKLVDILGLEQRIEKIRYRAYSVIILDALYKFYPGDGFDESDNAAMARLYTQLDAYAEYTGSAFVLIHHASKGDQSGKETTDIGAGAGAQSRACDAHMVLRKHEETGIYVIDCANRSFPPIQRFCARFKFPVWEAADEKDPDAMAGLQKKKNPTVGKKTARGPENAASASGSENSGQPASLDQAENTTSPAPESQKSPDPGPAKEVYISPEDREAGRLRDFCGGISYPMTILEIVELGKSFKFKTWTADHLRRTLLPSLIEKGQIALISEASGRIAAKYQGVPLAAARTTMAVPAEASEPPQDISDDEAYGPDLYGQDDYEPPPWSNDGGE